MTDVGAVRITAESPTKVSRAPSDILRLAVGLLALLVVVVVGLAAGDSVRCRMIRLRGPGEAEARQRLIAIERIP